MPSVSYPCLVFAFLGKPLFFVKPPEDHRQTSVSPLYAGGQRLRAYSIRLLTTQSTSVLKRLLCDRLQRAILPAGPPDQSRQTPPFGNHLLRGYVGNTPPHPLEKVIYLCNKKKRCRSVACGSFQKLQRARLDCNINNSMVAQQFSIVVLFLVTSTSP